MEVARRHSDGSGRSSGIIANGEALRGSKEYISSRSHTRFDASRAKEQVVQGTKASKRSVESWWKDPETKRKRRVAKYKFYAVEGKVKHSLKKGFKWIKNRCAKIISGF